ARFGRPSVHSVTKPMPRPAETSDIIRGLENGQINLGLIRPVEKIGSLRFSSIAHERYLLAVDRSNRLAEQAEIAIDDL
ncbi:LysR substrate-binding domain-containing protein, partial [Rhizobium ruizarguesonis]